MIPPRLKGQMTQVNRAPWNKEVSVTDGHVYHRRSAVFPEEESITWIKYIIKNLTRTGQLVEDTFVGLPNCGSMYSIVKTSKYHWMQN